MGVVYEGKNRRLVFDSFGRRAMSISADPRILADHGKVDNTAPIDSQKISENNCGQRSMAWLCVAAIDGLDVARRI